MTQSGKTCRSKSPVPGENFAPLSCVKERGHKGRFHSNPMLENRWEGGINTNAAWEFIDDGYMTQADWDTWGRFL